VSDILSALARWSEARGEAVAFSEPDRSVTFSQLARRVAGAADRLEQLPGPVGLLGASSIDWLVVDLGGWLAGCTIVPLPHFFSDTQLAHILADAGIAAVIAADDQVDRAIALGCNVVRMPQVERPWQARPMAGERIVYTSGSTGRPKGVRLSAGQIGHTCSALMQAITPTTEDRHLSVLPYALLLEAICGIYLPIQAGGACHIDARIVASQGADIAVHLGEAAERWRPTTMVLVPQLLQGLVMATQVERVRIPDSLRFVAVGGAAVPTPLAELAWGQGIPVHEGYGLTECGSVVAVNAPGQRRSGTVGRPLPGYHVSIDPDGEILVTSPSVCGGYHGGDTGTAPAGFWRTGDLGRLDADGFLQVLGRKDNLIVTANGRNIAPEWIETMLLADPRIGRCIVLRAADGSLAAIIEASTFGARWFAAADDTKRRTLVRSLAGQAPGYAIPRHLLFLPPDSLAASGLLTANGRPRRREIADHYSSLLSPNLHVTEPQHVVF